MGWSVSYSRYAVEDIRALDGSQRLLVLKAIEKVARNPLPQSEGGYGKPLGNLNSSQLAGYLKVKLKAAGIRIVYRLLRPEGSMCVVVVSARAEGEVYIEAAKRLRKPK